MFHSYASKSSLAHALVRTGIILFCLLLLSGLFYLFGWLDLSAAQQRFFVVGSGGGILGLVWAHWRRTLMRHEQVLYQLADRMALEVVKRPLLFGAETYLYGRYGEREVAVSIARRRGRYGHVMRVEMALGAAAGIDLKLWGPFYGDQALHNPALYDAATAAGATQYGSRKRYFIQSRPTTVAAQLVRNDDVWEQMMETIERLSISVGSGRLVLEQQSLIHHVNQLNSRFALLNSLAAVVEESAQHSFPV